MNKNVLIVLGGAVLVAVLVAFLVQISLGGKKAAPEDKVMVLVASKNLGIGTELKDDSVRWQEWPKSSVFPGAIIRTEKDKDKEAGEMLKGRLARDIASGEPVMKNALLGEAKGNFVAASLEPGMRAVAIEVSASSMVGGFIGPGDYVDVILTYKSQINTDSDESPQIKNMVEMSLQKMATETILQNVKILAVDQTAKRPEEEEKIKVGKTATLAVSAHDAEKLALAQDMGTLTLALRSVGDNTIVQKEWLTTSDARLISVDDEIFTEYRRMQNGAGINSNIVRIYNGPALHNAPARSPFEESSAPARK
jgi:pilus assembly protein CpaB